MAKTSEKMKVAFCGVWHVHAYEYCLAAKEHADVVGVYERDSERRAAFCAQHSLAEFKTFEELLESGAKGVIVCSSTADHTEDIIRLARAKKDIFTEKVLALTVEDAMRIKSAVEENGVGFVISLFQKYDSRPLTVKKILDSGELGKINYFRFRNCHNGSCNHWLPPHFYKKDECGGGALIDLGAHGMYLTDWLLGMPDSFASTLGYCYPTQVEDNAVCVMGYKNGAAAVNETSFVSNCCPATLELGGEAGYVYYKGKGPVIKSTVATDYKPVEEELCEAQPRPIIQFLTGDIRPGCGIDEAVRLTKMMCEAYKNSDEGRK